MLRRREAAVRSEPVAPSRQPPRIGVPESAHVAEIGLDQATDEEIWTHAGAEGFVVVSKGSDFRQLAFLYGPPPKVVWLRVGNVRTDVIHELLAASVDVLEAFDGSEEEALLVLDGNRSNASE